MSGWHRRNPDKDPSEEPGYWGRKITGSFKETLGKFIIECPSCQAKGEHCSIGGEKTCHKCGARMLFKDQIITKRKG